LQFYAEIRKEIGQEYEPDSLKVMQAALERYLKEKYYSKSILKDMEFLNSRKVLEGKARKLRKEGMGKRTLQTKPRVLRKKRKKCCGRAVSWATKLPVP